jgi:hypothetical protein
LASRPSGPHADRYARLGEARGSTTIQPRPAGGTYGYGGDTHAYSNRGRESRGVVNQQPAPFTPSISRRPTIPTPKVSQRPAIPAPGSSQQPTPVTPHVSSSGSKQPGSARASQQPARTPSVTFGGYRGSDEAREQSLRGQTSRQSSGGVRPSSAPAGRGGAPAGRNTSRERQGR